jgi:hypothetical protein
VEPATAKHRMVTRIHPASVYLVLQSGYIAPLAPAFLSGRRHNASNVEIHGTQLSTLADICATMNLA